jgi:hypothetical protein
MQEEEVEISSLLNALVIIAKRAAPSAPPQPKTEPYRQQVVRRTLEMEGYLPRHPRRHTRRDLHRARVGSITAALVALGVPTENLPCGTNMHDHVLMTAAYGRVTVR